MFRKNADTSGLQKYDKIKTIKILKLVIKRELMGSYLRSVMSYNTQSHIDIEKWISRNLHNLTITKKYKKFQKLLNQKQRTFTNH